MARARAWVMLVYRLPREPSTPRIALWRRLRQLGAVRLVDGVAMLPQTARTEEQLRWLAAGIVGAGGEASVWLSRATTPAPTALLLERMGEERAAEYDALVAEAEAASGTTGAARARASSRLRGELERVRQRDFVAPPARERAVQAIEALAAERPGARPAPAGQPGPDTVVAEAT